MLESAKTKEVLSSESPESLQQLLNKLFGSKAEVAKEQASLIEDCIQDTPLSIGTVQKILSAEIELDNVAKTAQKWRTYYAVIVALLAPVTVFCLACETLPIWTDEHFAFHMNFAFHIKLVCIILQLLLIGLALLSITTGWVTSRTHNTWLPARLGSEMLRRELFLYLARLGPYLGANDAIALANLTDRRIKEIKEVSLKPILPQQEAEILELLALEPKPGNNPSLFSWQDNLEDAYRERPQTFTDQLKSSLITLYAQARLEHQREYYDRKCDQHTDLDKNYDRLATSSIGLAFVVTVIDLCVILYNHTYLEGKETMGLVGILIWMLAPFLPTLGVFFITLRSFFENHRLARSFEVQVETLDRLNKNLAHLSLTPSKTFLPAETAFYLRRLILRTETLLSDELRRWWHILEPESLHG